MKFPEMDQKPFRASHASESESWGSGWGPSESPRFFYVIYSSNWVSRIKVDVLRSWSPPGSSIRPSATGKLIFHFLWEISLLLHWVFQSRFLMRPSFPTPKFLQTIRHPSKSHPRTERIQGTIQVRISFQIDGFLTCLSQKLGNKHSPNGPNGMIGPLNGFPMRLSFGVFPLDKRSWTFRR